MPVSFPDFPLADADRCVKCALCLPHCPTWRETRNEAESPRGRISLMQGFAGGALEITPRLASHLDQCLGCRACEAVCPADVPYGKLIDAAHAVLRSQRQNEHWLARALAWWVRGAKRLRVLHVILWCTQRSGLLWLAGLLPPLRRLTTLVPHLSAPCHRHTLYAARDTQRGSVNLFLGCIARITEPQVTDAALAVLNAAGYEVKIPAVQTCCGALDQHAGRVRQAARLAANNCQAFGNDNTTILSTASGCGASLAEYARLSDHTDATAFSSRHSDISAFLALDGVLDSMKFTAWPVTVVLHHPCTLRNVLKTEQATHAMLQHIPGMNIVTLPASTGCCGAAGSYLLNQPQMADRLGEQLAARIAELQPAALVTSNVGCAMHLAAKLAQRGQPLPVLHPVEVLARQLPTTRDV